MKLFVLITFLVSYLLIITNQKKSLLILYISAVILIISPALSVHQAVQYINFNLMGLFWGAMVLSTLFIQSGIPGHLSGKLISHIKTPVGAMLAVCGISSFISSYTENAATILIIGPIALEIAKRLDINPVPLIIGAAVSSNLQGCAMMIGDPPSMILATAGNMSFNDFFWMHGRPGIFFAVQIGAIASMAVLYLIFKRCARKTIPKIRASNIKTSYAKIQSAAPVYMIIGMVISLVLIPYIPIKGRYTFGILCILWGLIGIIWYYLKGENVTTFIKELDWHTFFFLIGIFILVGSLTQAGIITGLAHIMIKLTAANALTAFLGIVIISVIASAFIDNVPYTIAMIPVAQIIAHHLGVSPYPYLFGLLIGASVGGNITPIGASCNIVGIGILRRHGYQVKFSDFIKIGLPFTVTAVTLASLFIWLVWM